MSLPSLQTLADLGAAAALAEEARLRHISEEERRLRDDLARLDQARNRLRQAPVSGMIGVQSVGADMLWRRWTNRTRHDLNLKLALVLARKQEALRRLRLAHGRKSASEGLLRSELRRLAALQRLREAQQIDALSVLKAAGSNETGGR